MFNSLIRPIEPPVVARKTKYTPEFYKHDIYF
jgi:hypothetical protein